MLFALLLAACGGGTGGGDTPGDGSSDGGGGATDGGGGGESVPDPVSVEPTPVDGPSSFVLVDILDQTLPPYPVQLHVIDQLEGPQRDEYHDHEYEGEDIYTAYHGDPATVDLRFPLDMTDPLAPVLRVERFFIGP